MAISEELPLRQLDPRWPVMEDVLLAMREMWFGATATPFYCGRLLVEPEGELIAQIDGSPAEADLLVAEASRRRAYAVVTPFTRPPDLPRRLRACGYHVVQRQGTYVYEPGTAAAKVPQRRNLLSWFRRELPVEIDTVGAADLPLWNRICFEAFGPRGLTEQQSLLEKQRAYANMGERALWYIARAGGEPAGTAILYTGPQAGQVLAVGTLPRFRGRGIATIITRRALADFATRGRGFLFLDTRPGSQAERIYLSLGFQPAYVRTVYAP